VEYVAVGESFLPTREPKWLPEKRAKIPQPASAEFRSLWIERPATTN
jgi:hypothetical protein